jgi:hypothetical protein
VERLVGAAVFAVLAAVLAAAERRRPSLVSVPLVVEDPRAAHPVR